MFDIVSLHGILTFSGFIERKRSDFLNHMWRMLLRFALRFYPFQRGRTRLANLLLGGSGSKELIPFEGFQLEVDLSQLTSRLIFLFGFSEPVEIANLKPFLPRGFIAMDVGANIGEYSLSMAARAGGTGKVYAFEPDPGSYYLLSLNIIRNRLDSRIHAERIALTDYCGEAILKLDRDGARNTIAPQARLPEPRGELRIPCLTIDRFVEIAHLDRLDFIKIDAEGAELSILRGGRKALTDFRPVILAEVREDLNQRFGVSNKDVLGYLKSLGYAAFFVYGKKMTMVASEKAKNGNLFFIPDGR